MLDPVRPTTPEQFRKILTEELARLGAGAYTLEGALTDRFLALMENDSVPLPECRGSMSLSDRLLRSLVREPLPKDGLDGALLSLVAEGLSLKQPIKQVLHFTDELDQIIDTTRIFTTLSRKLTAELSKFLGEKILGYLEGKKLFADQFPPTSAAVSPLSASRSRLFEISGIGLSLHQEQFARLFQETTPLKQNQHPAAVVFLMDRALFLDGGTGSASILTYKAATRSRIYEWSREWGNSQLCYTRPLQQADDSLRRNLAEALENALFETTLQAPDHELGPGDRIARSLFEETGVKIFARKFSHPPGQKKILNPTRATLTAEEVQALATFFLVCRETLTPFVNTIAPRLLERSKTWEGEVSPLDTKRTLVRRWATIFEGFRAGEYIPRLLIGKELTCDPIELLGMQRDPSKNFVLKLGCIADQLFCMNLVPDRELRRVFQTPARFASKLCEYQLAIRKNRDPLLSPDELEQIRRLLSYPQPDDHGPLSLPPPTLD